jgi:hypothetical protein
LQADQPYPDHDDFPTEFPTLAELGPGDENLALYRLAIALAGQIEAHREARLAHPLVPRLPTRTFAARLIAAALAEARSRA